MYKQLPDTLFSGHHFLHKLVYIQKQSPSGVLQKRCLRSSTKFTRKQLCQSLFFNKIAGLGPAILFKKETLAQVFSCEFCETSKDFEVKRIQSGWRKGIQKTVCQMFFKCHLFQTFSTFFLPFLIF